jgi:A/G-specific adenine glycosylase
VTALQHALLQWARDARRDLPWRHTRDPWAILVSEVMLQQTQVTRVLSRYQAFLARFPTPAACAAAPPAEVIRLWGGLGYNRRALALHHTARVIVDRGNRFPDTLDGLTALPGVGPYTARAVLAFAFERDVAALDANARRALSRALGKAITQEAADALVPAGRGWEWNQGVLDLGAMVCRPHPHCDTCPLAQVGACAWRASGQEPPDPWPHPRPQVRFHGSDRQGRGRLVAALRDRHLTWDEVPAAAGWPDDPHRALTVARSLIKEGLVVAEGDRLRLP